MGKNGKDYFGQNELVDCYCLCWKYVFRQLMESVPDGNSLSDHLGVKPKTLKEAVKLRLIQYNDELLTRLRSKFEDFWKTFFDTEGFEHYPLDYKDDEEE
jgi:hypothetical protein